MHFMGIDLHQSHLTVSIRDDQGTVRLRRQVSTKLIAVHEFLSEVQASSESSGGYMAILEVCGFEGWLIPILKEHCCVRVVVTPGAERQRRKTDRRDASKLSELLWTNRDRLASGQKLVGIREVYQPSDSEADARRLTSLRHQLSRRQIAVKNSMKFIIRRHNLQWDRPTKGSFTKRALAWMAQLDLPVADRLQLDCLLEQYNLLQTQIARVQTEIEAMVAGDRTIALLKTVPVMGSYTALAFKAHIGSISRFPRARSLANYCGLTPGCRNSGETERAGRITKAGHPFIRYLLGQMVLHALRRDPGLRQWYRKVKARRGSNIARVAIMRRLAESIWHVMKKAERYVPVKQRAA